MRNLAAALIGCVVTALAVLALAGLGLGIGAVAGHRLDLGEGFLTGLGVCLALVTGGYLLAIVWLVGSCILEALE